MKLWKFIAFIAWVIFALSLIAMLIILWEELTSGSWRGKVLVSIGFAIYLVAWILIWRGGGMRKKEEGK